MRPNVKNPRADRHPDVPGGKRSDMDVRNLTADAEVFTSNAYFVEGGRPTLVDVGAMDGIISRVDALDAVVLTHQHGDHVAELDAVVDAFDPAVYAFDDHPARTHGLADGDEVRIGDGTFEAVYTPGHATDHVAFLGREAVFTGDVVVYADEAFEDGSFGRTDQPGQSRERLIESIETLLERLDPSIATMYPGHGPSHDGDIRAVIERARQRAARREPKYPED